MEAQEVLKRLVSIPSLSGEEEEIVDFLEEIFSGFHWNPQRIGRNLYTILGHEGPLLLLNSHTDTVPVGEGWTRDPRGEVLEGRLYGRGANDAKGCLTALIFGAARAFAKSHFRGRICIAATCEEECLGNGLESLLPHLPKVDAAVVGEPTGLDPAVAQKGLLILDLIRHGRAAHVAWGGGVNAIVRAADDIHALDQLNLDRHHPFLGDTTLEVTMISGGQRHNIIPDRCALVVDIRLTPSYSPTEIVELIRKIVGAEVCVRSDRLAPVATEIDHPIVKAALAARPHAKPFGSPTLSDWVFLRDVPTVKVGPGDSHRSHTPDEFLTLAELKEGIEFYHRLILNYFSER